MTQSRVALIVAIVLLLLPVLYVGSYLAMVTPGKFTFATDGPDSVGIPTDYRFGGTTAARIFWPLEQIGRKVRPGAWAESFDANFITPRIILSDESEPLGIEFE